MKSRQYFCRLYFVICFLSSVFIAIDPNFF